MKELISKLKSRKFIAALAGTAVGVAMIFGVDADEIKTVAGTVMSAASIAVYILTEGKVDAAAMNSDNADKNAAQENCK